ncbi:hypothetical protein Tco_0714741 [Tanacetum coccineum]
MFEDLEYIQSLEKDVDELEFKKADFSNEYDLILQECVSNDIMCSILRSFDSLDEKTDLQCLHLEKYQECEDVKTDLSKRNENVGNNSFNELTRKFAELEKHFALVILVTGPSQSRQHESRKSPTKSLFDVGSRRISIVTVNTKEYHSDVLAIITRIMRRTF